MDFIVIIITIFCMNTTNHAVQVEMLRDDAKRAYILTR